jgi:hypothetical protein
MRRHLTKKQVASRLHAFGVDSLVQSAIAGSEAAAQRLRVLAQEDPTMRSELLFLLPRCAKSSSRAVVRLSKLEIAGRKAGKHVVFLQGGSPGLKKR